MSNSNLIFRFFDRLLSVSSYEEAVRYREELLAELSKYRIVDCNYGLESCPRWKTGKRLSGKLCVEVCRHLFNSMRGHFLSLGLPLDIMDPLDELVSCRIPIGIFRKNPDINLLVRYSKFIGCRVHIHDKITPEYLTYYTQTNIFDIIFENNYVDFFREILERNLREKTHVSAARPPSPEMEELLYNYGKTLIHNYSPSFDFNKRPRLHEAYFYNIYSVLTQNIDLEDRMNILKSKGGEHADDFYLLVYVCYFVEGLENAKDFFPKSF